MKRTFLALTFATTMLPSFRAPAQSNVYDRVTYQGTLKDDFGGTSRVDGRYDFRYGIVIGPLDPDNPWPTNCPNCFTALLRTNLIAVNQGLFTTTLSIPQASDYLNAGLGNGTNVFLEFAVRTNGGGAFTTLSPLQPLSATPYAIVAQSVSGPIQATSITGSLSSGQLAGNYGSALSFLNPANVFVGNGSLLANVNATTIAGTNPCSLPCYWNVLGNSFTDPAVNFLGTIDNKALTFRVNDKPALRLVPSYPTLEDAPNLIGGHSENTVSIGWGSVIAGGGVPGEKNEIFGYVSAIGGGQANLIEGRWSFIGCGDGNRMNKQSSSNLVEYSVIAGGQSNKMNSDWAVIGGGAYNNVAAELATIAGGLSNFAMGRVSVVSGGEVNRAETAYSVVAGGVLNHASGVTSTVGGGFANVVSGAYGIIAGGRTNSVDSAADYAAIGGGYRNLVSGASSVVAGGQDNSASGQDSTIGGGIGNTNAANYTTIGGGFQNLTVGQDAVVAGGSQNSAFAGQSSIGGGIANTVRGAASTIAGGQQNYADPIAASIGGGVNNRISDGADYSVLGGGDANFMGRRILNLLEFGFQTNHAYVAVLNGGLNNTNIGYFSTLGGGKNNLIVGPLNNVEAAYSVVAGGLQNQVTAPNAGTIGGGRDNAVNYDYAVVPGGRSAAPNNYGELAFAAGHMDYAGDAQASTFVLRRKFNGNGDLFLNGDTGDARIIVPVGAVWTLHFQISGVSVTGTNFGSYEISGVIANVGGSTTFRLMDGAGASVGTARAIFETPGAVGWLATPYMNADTSLRVAVFAGETVKWCARIDVAEVRR